MIRALLDRRRRTAHTVPGLTRSFPGDRLPALTERQPGTYSPCKEPAPAPPSNQVRREMAAAGLPVTSVLDRVQREEKVA